MTKGHVADSAAVGERAWKDAKHLEPPSWLAGKVAREVTDVQQVILHAARCCHCGRTCPRRTSKLPGPPGSPELGVPLSGGTNGSQWAAVGNAASASQPRCRVKVWSGGAGRSALVNRFQYASYDRRGHSFMIAVVDDGPCLFSTACGACCTTEPKKHRLSCGGRWSREAAGTAALQRFREEYVPDCGDARGRHRRVHAKESLHDRARKLWESVSLLRRSEIIARHFVDRDIARASSLAPDVSQSGNKLQ